MAFSHYHVDHIGDPSTFPPSTDLVVGPGFKEACVPAYPTNPDAPVLESDYQDRNLREISFTDSDLTIGGWRAHDYFGDGSFYLLDSAGVGHSPLAILFNAATKQPINALLQHATGHMCALARTISSTDANDTFVLLAGDCAHHPAQFRPSPLVPLPETISPYPFDPPLSVYPHTCHADTITPIHRLYNPKDQTAARTQPFCLISANGSHDMDQARDSAARLAVLDADERVWVILAHDMSFEGVAELWPNGEVNLWREKGWKEDTRWKFLGDFRLAAEEIRIP